MAVLQLMSGMPDAEPSIRYFRRLCRVGIGAVLSHRQALMTFHGELQLI